MKQLNSIDDDSITNEDLPKWGCPSEFSMPDLQTDTPPATYRVSANVFVTRRYGLRSVKDRAKMVVSVAGTPMMVTQQLTRKFQHAFLWSTVAGPNNFAKGFEKKYGVELEVFVVDSSHVLSGLVE